jgi:nucleoside-diphosphate-sugar epimerase
MAKVLVTGASGFIGQHMAQALVDCGDRVTCLVRRTSIIDPLRDLDVQLVRGDVTDPDSLPSAIAEAEVVYHLAGLTKSLRTRDLWRVNEAGTRNLAQACANRASPPVLIVVSSLAAAGPVPHGRSRCEADPPRPVSNYGRSKRDGERAAEALAGRVPTTIVRPPIVFGEGDRNVVQMARPIARFGIHMVPGFAVRRFSLIHAADLASALILAAKRGARLPTPAGPRTDFGQGYYYVAADDCPSYAELGRLIAEALDESRFRAVCFPEVLIWLAAGAAQLASQVRRKPAFLRLDKAREAVAGSWICDDRRARDELGFCPAASLCVRLRQTITWYQQQGWLGEGTRGRKEVEFARS